jgi:hypothetical protein
MYLVSYVVSSVTFPPDLDLRRFIIVRVTLLIYDMVIEFVMSDATVYML